LRHWKFAQLKSALSASQASRNNSDFAQRPTSEAPLIRELENEREIIRRCQEGDLRAYEILYRQYEHALLGLGRRMLGQQQDAEDAVQAAFLKLYRGIGQFQFGAKFSTYLFRIMMNVCFDMIQKRRGDKKRDCGEREISHSSGVDLRLQLEEAIDALPERMRACFVLFAVEEMKQDEIAEILDLSVGTVKAQIFHAKARLRALLSDSPAEVTS
jgi:RNA polymerase sigma-70 factor (ECF subfamily)